MLKKSESNVSNHEVTTFFISVSAANHCQRGFSQGVQRGGKNIAHEIRTVGRIVYKIPGGMP
jgi:hypothetical protein